jgi:hypothetical protein
MHVVASTAADSSHASVLSPSLLTFLLPLNQVFISKAGNLTFTSSSRAVCPLGSVFRDTLGGQFGNQSYFAQPPVEAGCVDASDITKRSQLQFGCDYCGVGTYNLLAGGSFGVPDVWYNSTCLPCPNGAVCDSGAPVSTPGYWGAALPSGVASFALCPPGYCCTAAPCAGMSVCNGQRRGQLCGSCDTGLVEAIGSTECVSAASCSGDALVVWCGGLIGVAIIAWVQLAVVSGVWARSKGFPSGRAKLVVYFVQACGFVRVAEVSSGGSVVSVVMAVVSLRMPSLLSSGVCLSTSLTAVRKVLIDVALVALVGCSMVAMVCSWWAWRVWCRSRVRGVCQRGGGSGSRLSSGSSRAIPLLAWSSRAEDIGVGDARRTSQDDDVARYDDDDSDGGDDGGGGGGDASVAVMSPVHQQCGPSSSSSSAAAAAAAPALASAPSGRVVAPHRGSGTSLRGRLVGAGVNFALSAYSSVTIAVLKLLHCVSVPGTAAESSWLFLHGDTACAFTGWQLPAVLALAVLSLIPLMLPMLSRWAMRETSESSWSSDVREGVRRSLCASYTPRYHWWESVLMGQRLVLAAVYTFGSSGQPGVSVLVCTLVCVAALLVHVSCDAFRHRGAQHLQTALLACLTAVALSSGPYADAMETASVSLSVPSERAARRVHILFGIAVPVCAVVCTYVGPTAWSWCVSRRRALSW